MDKQKIFFYLESQKEFLAGVSDSVWDTPETCYEENVSAETVCRALEEAGFTVERNVAGISTAFMGTYGHGKPVIGFLGEFDALSGLSQTAGSQKNVLWYREETDMAAAITFLGPGALPEPWE